MRASILIAVGLACACSSPTRLTVGEPTVIPATVIPATIAEPTVAEPPVTFQDLNGSAVDQEDAEWPVNYVNPGLTQLNARFARISLGDDVWDPIEDQQGFGVEFSRESPKLDFGWEVGALYYSDDERDSLGLVESELMEVYLGARRTFGSAAAVWRPHLGGGISYMMADVQNQVGVSDDDASLALYGHAGLSAFVTRHLVIGLDVRALFLSRLRLHGENLDGDYLQIALTAGWSF